MGAVDEGRVIPGTPTGGSTLVEVLDDLRELGFVEDVQVDEAGRLCCRVCGCCVAAADTELLELRRVEGASDPGDMAAVLGVVGVPGLVRAEEVAEPEVDVAHGRCAHGPAELGHSPKTARGRPLTRSTAAAIASSSSRRCSATSWAR